MLYFARDPQANAITLLFVLINGMIYGVNFVWFWGRPHPYINAIRVMLDGSF